MTQLTELSMILQIEQQMLKMPQVAIPMQMHHAHKVAARQIIVPKGTELSGAIHKFTNLNVMGYGDMSFLMEDGATKRLTGYNLIVSPPGTKRIAYAHEDTLWITFFGTDETDADEIVNQFTTNSEQEYLSFRENLKLGA